MSPKDFPHKVGVDDRDWDKVNPRLVTLALWVTNWANKRKLPILFTSIIRPKDSISSSQVHQTGRGFDLSIRGWTTDDIDDLIADCLKECENLGALVSIDGKLVSRPVIFHTVIKGGVNYGPHFHFQVRGA